MAVGMSGLQLVVGVGGQANTSAISGGGVVDICTGEPSGPSRGTVRSGAPVDDVGEM